MSKEDVRGTGLIEYQFALERIAKRVGIGDLSQHPDQMATAICRAIDHLASGEKLKETGPVSESRPITASIHKIKLGGAANVVLRQGTEPKLEVFSGDEKGLAKVITKISGDTLTIDTKPTTVIVSGKNGEGQSHGVTQILTGNCGVVAGRNIYAEGGSIHIDRNYGQLVSAENAFDPMPRIEITLPHVNSLSVSGVVDITCEYIKQEELSIDVSGASDVKVSGEVTLFQADVSGAGSIKGYGLSSIKGRLHVSGTGKIKATVTQELLARASGVGVIKVAGKPIHRDAETSGLGKIKFA
jgi:hypothetical protein